MKNLNLKLKIFGWFLLRVSLALPFASLNCWAQNSDESFIGIQSPRLGFYDSDSKEYGFTLAPFFGKNLGFIEIGVGPEFYFSKYRDRGYSCSCNGGTPSLNSTFYTGRYFRLALQPHIEFNLIENQEDIYFLPYVGLLGRISYMRDYPTDFSPRNFWNYGWGLRAGIKYFFPNTTTALTLCLEAKRLPIFSSESILDLVDNEAYWEISLPIGIRVYF